MKNRSALIVGLGIALLVLLAIAADAARVKRQERATVCGNQMIAIAFAARSWAGDNNDRLPTDFRSMSNEVNRTRLLICPSDSSRQTANWSSLSATNCSYELLTPGAFYSETNGPFFRCPIHEFLAFPNGAVYDKERRVKRKRS